MGVGNVSNQCLTQGAVYGYVDDNHVADKVRFQTRARRIDVYIQLDEKGPDLLVDHISYGIFKGCSAALKGNNITSPCILRSDSFSNGVLTIQYPDCVANFPQDKPIPEGTVETDKLDISAWLKRESLFTSMQWKRVSVAQLAAAEKAWVAQAPTRDLSSIGLRDINSFDEVEKNSRLKTSFYNFVYSANAAILTGVDKHGFIDKCIKGSLSFKTTTKIWIPVFPPQPKSGTSKPTSS